ncbi:MAG: COX15/CtaA family protein [Actinomycetota bacterium]|nr:COX15/CtaA family protein [Actinomycetota bacterium]
MKRPTGDLGAPEHLVRSVRRGLHLPAAWRVPLTPSSEGHARARRWLFPTALATLGATYLLAVLGSTVRVTESGTGCKGWPLCDGQVGPVDQFHALIEQSHRYLAAAVTLGVVGTAVVAWRAGAGRAVLAPALWATGLVGVQVVLGAVTVVTDNAPPTVALHLVGALLLLAAVSATAVESHARTGAEGSQATCRVRAGPLAWWALGATFVLFVSGSLVVDGGASAACPSWPLCLPHAGVASVLVAIQLVHRTMAAVAVVLLTVLAGRILVRRRRARPESAFTWTLLFLLPAQVAAGAASALLRAPAAAQDVHLALAAAIWVDAVGLVTALRVPRGAPDVARLSPTR